MRQSLSVDEGSHGAPPRRTTGVVLPVGLALIGALTLAGAAVVDQLGGQALMDHAETVYADHDKQAAAGAMYGILYAIAVPQVVLWLWVLRRVRYPGWGAPALAVGAVAIGAGLAAVLLGVREYGERVYPVGWGLLALLPPVAGAAAVVQLIRRRIS